MNLLPLFSQPEHLGAHQNCIYNIHVLRLCALSYPACLPFHYWPGTLQCWGVRQKRWLQMSQTSSTFPLQLPHMSLIFFTGWLFPPLLSVWTKFENASCWQLTAINATAILCGSLFYLILKLNSIPLALVQTNKEKCKQDLSSSDSPRARWKVSKAIVPKLSGDSGTEKAGGKEKKTKQEKINMGWPSL